MATKKRNITYINKDFSELRASLVDYARTYFPTTYNDFTPASPGMMFMEMAAYVGDVLSFYLDNQIQENYLQYARQTNNLYELAYMFGYKPNVTQVATTAIDFYQQVPALLSGSTYIPDFSYALFIDSNAVVNSTSNSNISFLVEEPVDFSVSSSGDPTEVSIFSVSGVNPTYYLLKKTRRASSATINTTTFSFGAPVPFSTVEITGEKIVGILDITDQTTGDTWYEVDYLAQETIFDSIKNTNTNDPNLSQYSGDTPYILQLKLIQRRFATRFLDSTTLQLQFGSGTTADNDAEIIPNPDNVGLGLPFGQSKLTTAFSPSNFIFTNTYGIAPSNTTLAVRYLVGGGVVANVPSNDLTNITGNIQFLNSNLNGVTATTIFNSLAVTNPIAADGGGDGDSIEEIRQNASANFASQLRNVTQDDYLVRALSMPAKYGVISKAYIEPTKAQSISAGESQSVLDLYVLSYNVNNRLTIASPALKQNLTTYLSQYRMVNDSVNIKDGFIINIGVNFSIIVLPNFNSNDILTRCITALKDFFTIDKWAINEPIVLRDLYILLDAIEGVQTVQNITISNLSGEDLGYSKYSYDILAATQNNVVYPSLDPSIFEVKYPNTDIQGRVVNL
jgi:hypothetical protein